MRSGFEHGPLARSSSSRTPTWNTIRRQYRRLIQADRRRTLADVVYGSRFLCRAAPHRSPLLSGTTVANRVLTTIVEHALPT